MYDIMQLMFEEESYNFAAILAITAIVGYTYGVWTGIAVGGCVMLLCMAYVITQIGESGKKSLKDQTV